MGKYLTEKHNSCTGPNAVMIPLEGYSQQNQRGKILYDERADQGFVDAVLENKNDSVFYITRDMHINAPEFAAEIVRTFHKLQETAGQKDRKGGEVQNG